GPWKIYDYYIAVNQWSPSFNEDDPIQSILTWVRLPKLPIHFFNPVAVTRIGNFIGKTVRVDLATTIGARGRYALVCVEVDVTKPLLGKYMIDDKELKIEYESLENMCYDCGFYGHKRETCQLMVVSENGTASEVQAQAMEPVVEDQSTGEWMTVRRRNRRQQPKAEDKVNKPIPTKPKTSASGANIKLTQVQERVAVEAPEASSVVPKVNEHAASLQRVLEEALAAQSNGSPGKSTVAPQLPRRPLFDISNSSSAGGQGQFQSQEKQTKEMMLDMDESSSGLVVVPVMYQNPTFQSNLVKAKAPKTKEVGSRRGQNQKGKEDDPLSFLNGKQKRVVKKTPKSTGKIVPTPIASSDNVVSTSEPRKPPDRL
ncbi:hypothetical protein LINPERHAP1_LOCUS17357, partial [Linum perenne]